MNFDALDKVATLARSDENKAAGDLQQQRQLLAESSTRLSQLETFKNEYEQRLETLSREGMDARQLAGYRQFLANLNDAINMQSQQVSSGEAELELRREAFLGHNQRRNSVEELVSRGRADLLREEARIEQRQSDESSLGRHGHHQT
jgi:flagellar FliJ protein